MRMKVVEVNFLKNRPWLFRLHDSLGAEYFILHREGYAEFGVPSPVDRFMLDNFDVGTDINAAFEMRNGVNIVTTLTR